MATKADLRVSIPSDVKAGLDALARATGRQPGDIVAQALCLILDPLPALVQAQRTLAAYEQRTASIEDQLRVVADYCVDARRAQGGE